MVNAAYADAVALLTDHRDELDALGAVLLEREQVDRAEIERILSAVTGGGRRLPARADALPSSGEPEPVAVAAAIPAPRPVASAPEPEAAAPAPDRCRCPAAAASARASRRPPPRSTPSPCPAWAPACAVAAPPAARARASPEPPMGGPRGAGGCHHPAACST